VVVKGRVAALRLGFTSHVLALLFVACAACRHPAAAQRVDSARVTPPTPAPVIDTLTKPIPRPPLTPRRAFLYSVALPGYGQTLLGRPTAGALFVLSESIALAMLRESIVELRQARRLQQDSVVYFGVGPDGVPVTRPSSFDQNLVNVRRGHREDWVAFLIANHLFAGADAFVAAHLWDLPSQISLHATPEGTVVAARLRW
jgi:hypothetical protein